MKNVSWLGKVPFVSSNIRMFQSGRFLKTLGLVFGALSTFVMVMEYGMHRQSHGVMQYLASLTYNSTSFGPALEGSNLSSALDSRALSGSYFWWGLDGGSFGSISCKMREKDGPLGGRLASEKLAEAEEEARKALEEEGAIKRQLLQQERNCSSNVAAMRYRLAEETLNTTRQLAKCRKYVAEHNVPTFLPELPINNHYEDFSLPPDIPYENKERLAIILGFDAYGVHHFAKQLESISCYAALHNIPVIFEFWPLHSDRVPNRGRLRAYLKYLAYYQWVVTFDADTHAVQYNRSFVDYLDDQYDVILMERGQEVTSSHVMLRSTPFTVELIKDWMDFALTHLHKKNTDNGDLLEVLYRRYYPNQEVPDRGFKLGDNTHWHRYGDFKKRFHELIFGNLTALLPNIRIFRHEEGFMNHIRRTGMFLHAKKINITQDELYCHVGLLQ